MDITDWKEIEHNLYFDKINLMLSSNELLIRYAIVCRVQIEIFNSLDNGEYLFDNNNIVFHTFDHSTQKSKNTNDPFVDNENNYIVAAKSAKIAHEKIKIIDAELNVRNIDPAEFSIIYDKLVESYMLRNIY